MQSLQTTTSRQRPGRLLLLMTSTTYKARAFLEAASRLQVPVTIVSDRPQALASANPQGFLAANFAHPDKGAWEIVQFAQSTPVQAIIAADDDGVMLAAMAAEKLGLTHNPVAAVAATRNKLLLRQKLSEGKMRQPKFAVFSTRSDPKHIALRASYPCVLKPLFLSGSRGVIRADNESQFIAAFERIKAILQQRQVAELGGQLAGQIIVENYIPGIEIALEGLLANGRLKVLAIFDKPDPLEGPYFEETLYVTPSRLAAKQQVRVAACVAKAVAILGLQEGPVHAELRLNRRGPHLLEIAPRSIGGLCAQTLRFSEGISLEELILRQALGMDISAITREPLSAGVMMIPIPKAGILKQIKGMERARQVQGVEDIRITIPLSQWVVPLPEGNRYLGFIFARHRSPNGVVRALRKAHQALRFDIQKPGD